MYASLFYLFNMQPMLFVIWFSWWDSSGSKLSIGSIFGVSIVLGSKSFWPRIAYAMDGEQNMSASIVGVFVWI